MRGAKHKILVVRLGSLGDIVHTIPAQQQLADHFPASEIHWLVEPPYLPLLRQVPRLARLWAADTKEWRRLRGLAELGKLIASLRRERFQLALDFQGLLKSALLTRLSGARKRVGFSSLHTREPAASWFYSERVGPGDGGFIDTGKDRRHVIELNLELVHHVGCPVQATALIPLLIPEEIRRRVREKLQQLRLGRPILISPGAGWTTKLWPAQNYSRLWVEIQKRLRLPVVFTCGPGEEHLLRTIEEMSELSPLPAFPTNIMELAALCEQSRLFVGSDTGPLHLAVALGLPTVAIMGPTAPWRNGPFNPQDQIVTQNPGAFYSYRRSGDELDCSTIPVDRVLEAIVRRLELTERGA